MYGNGAKQYIINKESDYEKVKFLPNQCYSNNLNNILIAKYNMATILFHIKKYDESLEAYKELFTIQKHSSSLGPSHPYTLITMKNIAFILAKQKEYDKALKVYEELLTMQKHFSSLGPSHPDTLNTMKNIAFILAEQKEYDKALKVYEELFTMQKHFSSLGPSHPDTLTTMKNIAFILAEQKEYDKALKIYEEVFNTQKQIFGLYNSNTLNTRESITALLRKQRKHEKASLFFQKGQYDEALKIYEEILSFQRKFLEPYNPDIIIVRYNIAQVLSQQGKYSEALKEYKEVLSIQKDIFLDPDHPDIKQTESIIVIMQQKYERIKALDHSVRGILNSIKKLFCAKKQENCLQAKFYPKEKNNNIRSYGNEKLFLESVPNSTLIIDNIQTTTLWKSSFVRC
ncbi:tetratricopeptide repeat protein [Wolbachia endosymbiont (group A) of Udea olivalis]|uniref:tetratricopeptide repeat protein n=1 Tax=Wolbachia endosymbiont (group A) of Udea olivalis TaxID=3066183 RepID=UPI0031334012